MNSDVAELHYAGVGGFREDSPRTCIKTRQDCGDEIHGTPHCLPRNGKIPPEGDGSRGNIYAGGTEVLPGCAS